MKRISLDEEVAEHLIKRGQQDTFGDGTPRVPGMAVTSPDDNEEIKETPEEVKEIVYEDEEGIGIKNVVANSPQELKGILARRGKRQDIQIQGIYKGYAIYGGESSTFRGGSRASFELEFRGSEGRHSINVYVEEGKVVVNWSALGSKSTDETRKYAQLMLDGAELADGLL